MTDEKVLSINRGRDNEELKVSYIANRAKCLTCRHEFHAVAPLGTTWLECPACGLLMGRFLGPVAYEGPHWHCSCGNNLFNIMPDKTYCPCCGKTHVFS